MKYSKYIWAIEQLDIEEGEYLTEEVIEDAYDLLDKHSSQLIKIGYDDITIMKKDCQNEYPRNRCYKYNYNYNGIQNALCGNNKFDISRFYVFQMK